MPNKLASKKEAAKTGQLLKKTTQRESWLWTASLFQWSDLMIAAWKAGHMPTHSNSCKEIPSRTS